MNTCSSSSSSGSSRYTPAAYYEIDSVFIDARGWPSALIELALGRGVEEHKLLRGTGIFCEDITRNNLYLSPQQCFQLIHNLQKRHAQQDISFLLGHRLLVENAGAAQTLLANAPDLQNALDILLHYQRLLSPFLTPRLGYEPDRLVIYWQDACGAEVAQTFFLEIMATALSSIARWQTGIALPWQFYFTYNAPAYIEQYQVHLHGSVQFNAPANAMAISRNYLHLPWKKSNPDIAANALASAVQAQNIHPFRHGFLAETYNYLHKNIHNSPNLEQSAADFGMSSASLKRKLQKHHSSFQQQFDLVRKHLALHWLSETGITQEEVAKQLHFYDAANLRRAFKRWTGHLPGKL